MRRAGLALCIAGFLLIGYGLYDAVAGRIYQAWAPPPIPPYIPATRRVVYQPGSAIGRLDIPRIGLSLVVLEGSDTSTLRLGVGRVLNSSLPGEPGNVVLAAHRDTFFRPLREIHSGDRISLRTSQGSFAYTVDWTKVVDPTDTSVLMPTPQQSLTLVTCYPFYYVGSAPQRFIVRAQPVAPAAAATVVPTPPAPKPPKRPKPAVRPVPVAVAEPVAADAPPPPPAPGGIRGVFRKIGRAFGARRAKLQ